MRLLPIEMNEPDFEALRTQRNARLKAEIEMLRAEGFEISYDALHDETCYCDCVNGGPCEHKWDGELWESEDGRASSFTCSRCGMVAMSHDMRCVL